MPVSEENTRTYGLSWFWEGNNLAFGSYIGVTLKTPKYENAVLEQVRWRKRHVSMHQVKSRTLPPFLVCWAAGGQECAGVQTRGALVCFPRLRVKASG